jgi:uncharacterized cupredoxin-like copper-binding protein
MHPRERRWAAALSCGLALIAQQALAHNGEHPNKPNTPLVKEQKAWGIASDATAGVRTIRVSMNDQMRFVPASISIGKGETVRFIVKNDGKLMHEFVIGTRQELDEHAELMKKFPNMEHDEPYMVHVEPGRTGEIVWTFNRAGEFDFACLIAGHYEAGMVGKLKVNGWAEALRSQ